MLTVTPVLLGLRRWFLIILIVSLGISALTAIFILIFGEFVDTEGKIIFTTLTISLYSLTGMGSAASLERGRWSLLSYLGLMVAIVGFAVFLPGIWAEWIGRDNYSKFMASIGLFSFSFAQSSLLSTVRLQGKTSFLMPATILVIFALASFVTAVLFAEPDNIDLARALGVLAVLDGFGTVSIPLVSRIGPAQTTVGTGQKSQVEVRCPRCNTLQHLDEGGARCRKCSLEITVRTQRW